LAKDPKNEHDRETEVISQPQLMPEGAYYFQDTSNASRYDYAITNFDLAEPVKFDGDNWKKTTWYGKTTYFAEKIEETKVQTIHTHTIDADRPITIRLIGNNQSDVSVISNSTGRVVLAGAIVNPTGTTTASSQTSIDQIGEIGSVGGRRVVLSAATTIGSESTPLQTNVSDTNLASLLATTTNGQIHINETIGGLAVDRVIAGAGSDVNLTSQGAISVGKQTGSTFYEGLIQGGAITLSAGNGGIGTEARPMVLNSGTLLKDKVNATGAGGVYLTEKSGDLRLEQVTATGDVVINVVAGDLIDANREEVRDERTFEELKAGVWTDLQLTDSTGAQDKITETLDAFRSLKEQEYNTYWQFRNTQADPSTYDSGHQVTLSAIEEAFYRNELGFDNAAIATLEAARTVQYHILHNEFGAFGDTFDPNFSFTLTTQQETAIRGSIKVWTEEELLNTISAGLFKSVSDTQVNIEDPNIIGDNVTVTASGSVGQTQGQITIDVTISSSMRSPASPTP
jgi:hypothetical protein